MKTIQHTIGGKEQTLDVGKMWFSKYFGEATKSDPILNFNELLTDTEKQYYFVCALVYAGVNCYNKANKINEFVMLETVNDWVGSMEDAEAGSLINKYVSVLNEAKGEVQPQVESPLPGTN